MYKRQTSLCPRHLSIPPIPYCFVCVIVHLPSLVQTLFLRTLLSKTLKLCMSLLSTVKVSAEYVTTGLIKVFYNLSLIRLLCANYTLKNNWKKHWNICTLWCVQYEIILKVFFACQECNLFRLFLKYNLTVLWPIGWGRAEKRENKYCIREVVYIHM